MKKRKGSASKIPNINTMKRCLAFESNSVLVNESECIPLEDLSDLPHRMDKRVVFCSSPTYMSHADGDHEVDTSNVNEFQLPLEQQAVKIVNVLEQDNNLMADNPSSEQRRLDTLREMTESLTLKRTIKKKLENRITQKSSGSPLSLHKRLKYQFAISLSKFNLLLKEMSYSVELWYSSIRIIEGHYGSAVATFFRFFRWLFIMNFIVFFICHGFVIIPQIVYDYLGSLKCMNSEHNFNTTNTINKSSSEIEALQNASLTTTHGNISHKFLCLPLEFSLENIITGEGYFTNTILYYGHYSNELWEAVPGMFYNMPMAYFFTFLFCYFFIFISLSVSMAKSYRKSFIETSRGVKNIYAHKILCGWDFSIASKDSALLKSKSIYHDLQELLNDGGDEDSDISENFCSKYHVLGIRFSVHAITCIILLCTGGIMWVLLSINLNEVSENKYQSSMITSLIVTVVMIISPVLFSWVVQFEEYKSPRTALYITLTRTYLLGMVVISVLLAFWLKKSESEGHECWETSLGQEVYRLIIMDFIFAVVGTACAEFMRKLVHRKLWKKIGQPEFDIARNTLNLIYNETLFFVGFFFSPPLSLVIIVKMFITFYIKKFGALKNCQPPLYTWRAAQTHTLFLVLSFVSLLGVLIVYGYILTNVQASNCGPLQGYPSMYQMILEEIFQLKEDHDVIKFFVYITKPGVVAGILIGMCVGVYYLRAQSRAQIDMVNKLQSMLLLEAKDKEFLVRNIANVTNKCVPDKRTTSIYQNISTDNQRHSDGSYSSSLASQRVTEWLLSSPMDTENFGASTSEGNRN